MIKGSTVLLGQARDDDLVLDPLSEGRNKP